MVSCENQPVSKVVLALASLCTEMDFMVDEAENKCVTVSVSPLQIFIVT